MLSEVREERNWDKAHENYEDVQRFIIKAEDLELYGDVERLVPPEFAPECVEMLMEIEEYVRDDGPPKRAVKSPKSKKNSKDPKRNIPASASLGFVVASQLVPKGGGSQLLELDDDALEDDSDDQEIMAGINGPRRTASMPTPLQTKKKSLRRSVTTVAKGAKKPAKSARKKKQKVEQLTLSQLDRKLEDDSDDEAIERGLTGKPSTARDRLQSASTSTSSPDRRRREPSSSPEIPFADEVIDLTTPDPPSLPRSRPRTVLSSLSPDSIALSPQRRRREPSSSPEIPLTDEMIDLTVPDPPILPHSRARTVLSSPSPDPIALSPERRSITLSDGHKSASQSRSASPGFNRSSSVSSRSNPPEHPAQEEDPDMAWLLDDDDDDDESEVQFIGSSPLRHRQVFEEKTPTSGSASTATLSLHDIPVATYDSDAEIMEDEAPPSPTTATRISGPSPALHLSSATSHSLNMPPPPLPMRFAVPTTPPQSSPEAPEPTFAVRGPSKGKKRVWSAVEASSSPLAMPVPAQRRLQRGRSPSPPHVEEPEKPRPKRRKFRDIVEAQRHNPWMDVEASHSGDEYSGGGSEGDELGSEGDRRFVEDLPETQVSPSYDQSAVYRRSLLTQAGSNMPAFANRPMRRGAGYAFRTPSRPRRQVQPSSSPRRREDSDDYVFGSFIVDDDEEISYVTDKSLLSDT